jgi:N6-L-threonylcarbamoyladenine synthase
MGYNFAKGLAAVTGAPLVGVNHIEGHIWAAKLDNPDLELPFVALVVSGGHTELVEVREFGKYKILARTNDDAAGEAFDKSAALLSIAYPGGAALARLADSSKDLGFKLPKVMRESEGFSFSGLKTAVAQLIRRSGADSGLGDETRGGLAFAIQEAIIDTLVHKTRRGLEGLGIKNVCITGGVAANRRLRERLQSELTHVTFKCPTIAHCVDNGAMIAYVAGLRYQRGERLGADAGTMARWPVEELEAA